MAYDEEAAILKTAKYPTKKTIVVVPIGLNKV